ncbi:adenylate kinase isoenzyme 1-like isoform X2 [Fopius arisanus]|uniref:Adenylate kinase isoenzyme 1-like isoform X2 n=1 Tax=Fopius arisanus TaxID=64838 RepID=A0A9R1U4X1_9HYME|nr:PREDICTED: adenylate kinase isoenzyme 1-like isoform X2 [Fopius arisanus]
MGNRLTSPKGSCAPIDENPLRNSRLPIIFILGGPGAGKGTQCERLARKYGYLHISSGELLREEASKSTERGLMIDKMMGRGEPIPVELLLELIKEKMMFSLNYTSGFILDGYPREKSQAKLFEKAIRTPDVVIYLKADERLLRERLLGRAITSGRKDDNEETIGNRIKLFARKNRGILKYYRKAFVTINAEQDMETVFNELSAVVDNNAGTSQFNRIE